MKKISLGHKRFAIVDDGDYAQANNLVWHCYWSKHAKTFYAKHSQYRKDKTPKTIYLSRYILNEPDGLVDHKNHNGLDNRRSNLRVCTRTQNNWNSRKYKKGISGYKGVNWHKSNKKWVVRIANGKGRTHFGYFSDLEKAIHCYRLNVKKLHSDFAYLEALRAK